MSAGTWEMTIPPCDCSCPSPSVRVGYSERVDVGSGFTDWSDYDYSNVLTQANTDPANGGTEIQVRVRFEVTNPNGLPGVIRWRQVDSFSGGGIPPETVYNVGATQVWIIPTVAGISTQDYEFTRSAIGFSASLIGAPARANLTIIGQTQSASLSKKGFTRYLPDGLTVHIYKGEAVTAGGDPGCPANSRPPRVYSGAQSYTPGTASEATDWITDPAGIFTDTRSPNLIEDKAASTPFGQVNKTVEFGIVSYSGVTVKTMSEQYACGPNPQAKTLSLDLSAPYSTDDLTGAVDAALDTQEGLGANVFAVNGTCVHRQFLASDETFYSRVRTTSIRAIATPQECLATRGDAIDLHVSCIVLARSLTLPATVSRTPKTFTARLYADGYLTGPFGRGSHQPDPTTGETDVPPEVNPWEDPAFDGMEILLIAIKVKPHVLMVTEVPFAELTSVLAEGVDGE